MIDERIRYGDGWTFKSTIEVYLANIILLCNTKQSKIFTLAKHNL